MTTSKDKITSGMNARQNPQNKQSLSGLQGAPTDLRGIKKLAKKAVEARRRARAYADAVNDLTADYRAEAEAKYGDMDLPKTQVQNIVKKDADRYRRKAVQAARADLDSAHQELREINTKLEAVRDSWGDAAAVLQRATRNSERRSTLAANLANSGPAELQVAAQDAVAAGDRELASAVLARMDSMTKRDRDSVGFSRQELAESVAGDEQRQAAGAIAVAELSALEAELADAEAQDKRSSSSKKTNLGLKRRQAEEAGVTFDPDTGEPVIEGEDGPAPGESWGSYYGRNPLSGTGDLPRLDKRDAVLKAMRKQEKEAADAA